MHDTYVIWDVSRPGELKHRWWACNDWDSILKSLGKPGRGWRWNHLSGASGLFRSTLRRREHDVARAKTAPSVTLVLQPDRDVLQLSGCIGKANNRLVCGVIAFEINDGYEIDEMWKDLGKIFSSGMFTLAAWGDKGETFKTFTSREDPKVVHKCLVQESQDGWIGNMWMSGFVYSPSYW